MSSEIPCERNCRRALRTTNGRERAAADGGSGGLGELPPWKAKYDGLRWQEALRSSIDEEAFGQRFREASRRGRPLGDKEFVENLERRCGRRLRARPVGRPKKISAEEGGHLSLVFEYAVPGSSHGLLPERFLPAH